MCSIQVDIGRRFTDRCSWSTIALLTLALAFLSVGRVERGLAQEVGSRDTLQIPPPDTFADARTRSLFEAARERWLQVGSSILSYDAMISSRVAINLRTPLKDRTIFRAEETFKVHWSADSTLVVQALAARSVTAGGDGLPGRLATTEMVFDPTGDQFVFGFSVPSLGAGGAEGNSKSSPRNLDDDDNNEGVSIAVRFEHPAAPGAEEHYRYEMVDSVTVLLSDGRPIRSVGLEVIPRRSDGSLISGILWIEPESGDLVRAVYRLSVAYEVGDQVEDAPGMWVISGLIMPLSFNFTLVTVDYSLWDLTYWMPSRWRIEAVGRAGILRAAGTLEQSYQILDVVSAQDAKTPPDPEAVVDQWLAPDAFGSFRAVDPEDHKDPYGLDNPSLEDGREAQDSAFSEGGQSVLMLVPEDPEALLSSDLLPPPVWMGAPGFATASELVLLERDLADLSIPDGDLNRFEVDIGPQLGELTRYNRAEGLAIGARAAWSRATQNGLITLESRGWIGIGSGEPDVRLQFGWESVHYRLSLTGHHRVNEVDLRADNLGIVNSLTGFFFGRDDGDYFRASGARLKWEPTGVRRPWWHISLTAEGHRALPNRVGFSVRGLLDGGGDSFRPALEADCAMEYLVTVSITPWWGTDPSGAQGGLEILLQSAEGDFSWIRARTIGRLALTPAPGLRAAFEIGGGLTWGTVPMQRNWFLGGPGTLRGYPGASAVGPSYLRGRAELARDWGTTRLALFSDWGWAGQRFSNVFEEGLPSIGAGFSALDGLIRLDIAGALRSPTRWRLEFHFDSIL